MKQRLSFAVLFLITSSLCFGQKQNFEFAIIFGEIFKNDSVDVKVNGRQLVYNKKIESNTVGSSDFDIIQYKKNLIITSRHHNDTLPKIIIDKNLNIELSVNNVWKNYSFDLKKGKIIFVQYNWNREPISHREVVVKQQNYPVFFL